jgi:hypothetical protein
MLHMSSQGNALRGDGGPFRPPCGLTLYTNKVAYFHIELAHHPSDVNLFFINSNRPGITGLVFGFLAARALAILSLSA